MANRYQVIEAHPSGNTVEIQAINAHASFNSIYWYYPSKNLAEYKCLFAIDTKLQIVYNWQGIEQMMIVECLMRIRNGTRLTYNQAYDFLKGLEYIDVSYNITNKGLEHLDQFERKSQTIQLGKINTGSKLFKAK